MSVWAVLAWGGCGESHADGLQKAASYADSVYFANIDGDYARGIRMADTAFCMINAYYATLLPASCWDEHLTTDGGGEEELKWWAAGVKADYHLIMGLRNEVAIAALALRRWDVYGFNNFQFSHLYKLLTKDSSLEDFYLQQRKARSSLNMGIVLLVLLVSLFALSAYVVYFRRRILFRFNVMQVLPLALHYRDEADALRDVFVYDDGIVKGMMSWGRSEEPQGRRELCELYIDPCFQHEGVGARLIGHFTACAAADGMKTATLWVLEENPQARCFYEKMGFAFDGNRKQFPGTEAWLMEYTKAL